MVRDKNTKWLFSLNDQSYKYTIPKHYMDSTGSLYIDIYVHAITMNEKMSHEFEGE